MKPRGFWYEVDGDWRRWCEAEEWGDPDGPLYDIQLDGERILNLRSEEAVRQFGDVYGGHDPQHETWRSFYIDWQRVADIWDGIEIAPYQWGCRFDLMWYYGWDCASGVIWRPKGVRVVRAN